MSLSTAAKNAMLTPLAPLVVSASLHTADPGLTGANEVSGWTYARQPVTWGAAAGGVLSGTVPEFDVPAAGTVTHFGLWSAAGAFVGGGSLSAPQAFPLAGHFTVSLTVTLP